MAKNVNCFIPYQDKAQVIETINGLKLTENVSKIFLLSTEQGKESIPGCEIIVIDSLKSTATIKEIASRADSEYTLIYLKESTLVLGMFALERMLRIADDTKAAMVYADHYQIIDGKRNISPVITYQEGSLRDDFNFGSVLVYRSSALKDAAAKMSSKLQIRRSL